MTEPVRFLIPEGAKRQSCMSCGAAIYWIETRARKRMPVDPDGVSHFATCKHADAHRGKTRAQAAEQLGLLGEKGSS